MKKQKVQAKINLETLWISKTGENRRLLPLLN